MTISEDRLKELLKAESQLRALEAGGVDNWIGYGEAMREYLKQEKEI